MTLPLASTATVILGGTFDPIHIGHLRAALEAAEAFAATVRLLPAPVPPHRPQPWASAADRLAMLKLAVDGQPQLLADDRELRRAGPSYSVDTLGELRAELGADRPLMMLVGADAFAGLPSWMRWREIFELAHVVVLTRPGAVNRTAWSAELTALARSRETTDSSALLAAANGLLLCLPVTPLAISATAVRAALQAGRSLRWLLPEPVLDYIERHRLYRATDA
jgi:nicotinate-nucleotide adenylyltransferase